MEGAVPEQLLPEMSRRELEREIHQRTQRYDMSDDGRIGVALVTAVPLDQKHSPIVRSGHPPEDVLRQVLRALRVLQRAPRRPTPI